MAFNYTADQMVESVKARIRIPEGQSTYTQAKIFTIINEELERHVVPKIMACRENYFMYEEDVSITSGQSEYKIPYRAIGGKIKAAKLLNSQGEEQRMKQIPYESAYIYQNGDYREPLFYIKRNSIKMIPTPTVSTESVRFGYYIKPSMVVAESACATITAINTSANSVTVSSLPSSMSTNSTSSDLVRSKGGFECLAIDQAVNYDGSEVYFPATLPTDLAVGDYVCLATETPIPQIPADIHSYLSLRVCKVLLEGLGYYEEATRFDKDIKEAEAVFDTMLTPRTEGNPKKIQNWYSPIRR